MPFKSDKQRKWMHANEPEMAKKWEKEEAIKGKLRNLIKQEIKSVNEDNIKFSKEEMAQLHKDGKVEKNGHTIEFGESINEGFDKYYLSSLLDSNLKKKLEIAIKKLKGKVDGIGDDWIWFRMPSHNLDLLTQLITKLDRNKNVWIGDKRKNNIWDRRQKINKLEATTTSAIPPQDTPTAFKKSTQTAIDVDDEDDEKNESINEVRWPDTQTARLLSQAFKDARVRVSKVWEKGNHEYIIRVRAKDGNVNVRMELNVVSNVIMLDTQSGHVRLGELQPGSRGRKLSKNLKMLSKLPSFGVAGFKGLKYKIESINERKLSSHQKKAILIAIEMSGNMTGAVKKIERIKRGLSNDKKVKDALRLANESMAAPFRRRNSRGLGRVMKVGLNELSMAPFSSQEARLHIDADIKKMSKELGNTSHDIIKIMMDGVKRGRYTPMDIARGIKEGPAKRTHFGELTFIQQLWNKVREKFRRYSKHGKLS